MKQYGHVIETQEALVEERHKLMRHWLLLGLHMGIVTACTLSPYQQVGGWGVVCNNMWSNLVKCLCRTQLFAWCITSAMHASCCIASTRHVVST